MYSRPRTLRCGYRIGQNVKMLMPPPYRDEHDGYIRKYQQTGEGRVVCIGREVAGWRKDGSTIPLELSVGALNQGGRDSLIRLFTPAHKRAAMPAGRSCQELVAGSTITLMSLKVTMSARGLAFYVKVRCPLAEKRRQSGSG